MPEWYPSKVCLKNAPLKDKKKIVSQLAELIYAAALAKDKLNPKTRRQPSVKIKRGA